MTIAALPLMTDDARTAPQRATENVKAPAQGELSPGEVLAGRHKIERWMSSLPSAELYLARHATISTLVYVVKVLKSEFLDIPESVEQFRVEADTVSKLRSPFTVRVTDMGTLPDGRPFLCREFYAGTSLDEYLADNGPLDELLVRRIAADVLASLSEAHELGIVHRDIQPRGIILSASESRRESGYRARVLDFGSAYTAAPASDGAQMVNESNPSLLLTTPQYTAPEVLRGTTLPASDIYALGLMLAELLEGEPVYKPDNYLSVATRQLSTTLLPLGERALASGIAEVLLRATAKSLDERYASATEMLEALLLTPLIIDGVQRVDLEQAMADEYWPHHSTIERHTPPSAPTRTQNLDPMWERASALLDSAPTDAFRRGAAELSASEAASPGREALSDMATQRTHRLLDAPLPNGALPDASHADAQNADEPAADAHAASEAPATIEAHIINKRPTGASHAAPSPAAAPRLSDEAPAQRAIDTADADAPAHAPTLPQDDDALQTRGERARTYDILLRTLLIIGILATGLALLLLGLPG